MDLSHLVSRSSERLESHFKKNLNDSADVVIIGNDSDVGVMRNGGRNGARFAPEAIINILKKMTWPTSKPLTLFHQNISDQKAEILNFENSQKDYQKKLQQILARHPSLFFHLGGGHDHIYQLLMALGQNHKKIAVINLDAHCDTRKDKNPHSGNPFRLFGENYEGEFKLIEVGLHHYSNSSSTQEPLKKGQMSLLFKDDPTAIVKLKNVLASLDQSWILVFSVDCDGLDVSIMEAVSAPNPNGFTYLQVMEIMENLSLSAAKKYFGFYEYNPLYDSLSSKGARVVASLIYEEIRRRDKEK